MSFNFDARETRNSFGRKLTILQHRISVFNHKTPTKEEKMVREEPSLTKEEIFSQDNAVQIKKDHKSGFVNHFSNKKSQGFIKLFISQLKKNSANSLSEQQIQSTKMMKEIDEFYDISYKCQDSGLKGIKSKKSFELSISILTVIAILLLHFLSTFQCLFHDYRSEYITLPAVQAIKYGCLLFTLIKIVSSFTLVITVLGKKIELISQIAYNYVTSIDFYLDILVFTSAILLLSFHNQYSAAFSYIVTIMNVVYIDRMENAIDIYFINNNTKKQLFALFKLLLANFFVVHLMATLLVGLTLIENEPNWMDRYGIYDSPWWVKYIYSLYWSASIVATVGFGDIIIYNYIEAAVMTFIILIGCIILSYNIAEVGNIINQLARTPNEVKHQLSVLRRLAEVSKIDQNLHHSIGEYIVHSAQIKKSFEIRDRTQLIQMLPSQMREEFIEQSSRNFCASIPFFFMLQNQTQKLACQKLKLEVLSPNEYITHKRLGLTKIYILRKGVIGLAYKKRGSRLNGVVLDKISIINEHDDPQLLNTYLLVRGKKLVYDIICQEYCVVGCLQYPDFFMALKESERDFQLFHQSRDEASFRINEWDKKKCEYCNVKHSIFVCPKMHYIPLRSQTFLKAQKGKANNTQTRSRFKYRREKAPLARYSPIKLWKKLFTHVELALETKVQKSQLLRINKTYSTDEQTQRKQQWQNNKATKILFEHYFLKYYERVNEFDLDVLKDFKFYFHKQNPHELVEQTLNKNFHPIVIERLRSC